MIPINPDGSLSPVRKLVKETEGLDGFMSGMHCARVMSTDKQVGAMCVGSGEFVIYDTESGERVSSFRFGDMLGPRHFVASRDDSFVYGLMQMPPEVHVLKNNGGSFERLQVVSAVNPGHTGRCGASEIRMTPDGSMVMAATRGTDTIAVFKVRDDGTLEEPVITKMPGETPRDFNISPDGRIVVTALQFSDEISVHEIDYESGKLIERFSGLPIPSPAAVEII
jgi:6-phosphogluconolactonase